MPTVSRVLSVYTHCCFSSTETKRTIKDGPELSGDLLLTSLIAKHTHTHTHTHTHKEKKKKMGEKMPVFQEKASIIGKQKVDWVDWLARFYYTEAAIIQLCLLISVIIIT